MVAYTNPIVGQDLQEIASAPLDWQKLEGKSVLITGAGGAIASYIVYTLAYLRQAHGIGVGIKALVRTPSKVEPFLVGLPAGTRLSVIKGDVDGVLPTEAASDYIFHIAGNASPHYIATDPVGIIRANTLGTVNVCELAAATGCKKLLFASTREIYGDMEGISPVNEDMCGKLDPLDPRSCYPESKRMAETICRSYQLQHGLAFNTARIAHTYGPGMSLHSDGRIMSDLLGAVAEGRDIVLKSDGKAERAFCYITDTIRALFTILLHGAANEAYNVSNEREPVSIAALAGMLSAAYSTKVIYEKGTDTTAYTSYQRSALSTAKLEKLGWQPHIELKEGIKRTIQSHEQSHV